MKSMSNARKELERINCRRKYRPHPLQKQQSHASYWEKQINKLEKSIRFPDSQKLECLRNILTAKEIADVINSGIRVYSLRTKYESFYYKSKKSSKFAETKRSPIRSSQQSNPFIEFMKKSKKDACFWHEKPSLRFEDTRILERADIIENKIVKEFMEKFGEQKNINEDVLWSIFELTCPYPICKALYVTDKIFASMPETTTSYLGCPEKSYQNKLQTQIRKDISANKKPTVNTAFGTSVPTEMRRFRSKTSPTSRWETIKTGQEDIETFQNVFKDITELESTRKFCMYLLEHPEVPPPAFLKDQGMLVKNLTQRSVYLGQLEKKLENRAFSDLLHLTKMKEKKATSSFLNSTDSDSFSFEGNIFDFNVLLV